MLGLICEYNPFHNGHILHLKEAKRITKSENIIVVMSGNFVQRGEPAILDKYVRTELALLNGADVVIELPVSYSTSSAEYFAKGAIYLLKCTGIVNKICFGSETNELNILDTIANFYTRENLEYKNILNKYLSLGLSYVSARNNATKEILKIEESILKSPNNILGIEYLKALKNLEFDAQPYIIKRLSEHNSTNIKRSISSGSGIRKALLENNLEGIKHTVPNNTYNFLKNEIVTNSLAEINNLSEILHYILRSKDVKEIKHILDITEGLENRILEMSKKKYYITDIMKLVKTKRYTLTKIQRGILHIILDINKDTMASMPSYIRILGFKREKQYILKELKEKSKLPIIINLKNATLYSKGLEDIKREIFATDIYNLSRNNYKDTLYEKNIEYKNHIIKI